VGLDLHPASGAELEGAVFGQLRFPASADARPTRVIPHALEPATSRSFRTHPLPPCRSDLRLCLHPPVITSPLTDGTRRFRNLTTPVYRRFELVRPYRFARRAAMPNFCATARC